MSSRTASKSRWPDVRPARILVFLILAFSAGLPTGAGFWEWLLGYKEKVFLELDYAEGEWKPPKPRAMKRWYADVGLRVRGVREANEMQAIDGDACVSRAYIDELFETTRMESPPDDAWYVHGLVLPYGCVGDETDGPNGQIWFLDDKGDGIGTREAFIILDKNFALTAAAAHEQRPMSNDEREAVEETRTWTIAHEMAHVFNAHHCELENGDGWSSPDDEFGEWTHLHFEEMTENIAEVMPGGTPWCDNTQLHEEQIHKAIGTCKPGCGEPYSRAYTGTDLTLEVRPEKARYFPGEPIHVDVTVKAKAQMTGSVYYVPASLNRASRFLEFEIGNNNSALEPLRRPVLEYRPLKLAKLPPNKKIESQALDVSFGLPRTWMDWNAGDTDKSLVIKASYTMFVASGADFSCVEPKMKNCERVRVVSQPVKIKIGLDPANLQLFDLAAHKSFTSPETRRFLWLGGGDRLNTAKSELQAIASNHPNTIYARYAEVALGMGLATRRHRLDPVSRAEALKQLGEAEKRKAELPPSYQRLLDRQIDRVKKMPEPR